MTKHCSEANARSSDQPDRTEPAGTVPPGSTAALESEVLKSLPEIGPLVHGCHRQMGSPLTAADVDEVIQETSLAAWCHRQSFRGDADVESWLYGIARRTILLHLRRGRRVSYSATEIASLHEKLEAPAAAALHATDTEFESSLSRGLSKLGTTLAIICRARAVDGQSFRRISEDLHLSPANVKTRFYRSLPELRRRFGFLRRRTDR